MVESLFNKVAACNFVEKETLAHVFSCEFCEITKNIFFTEHVWVTASAFISKGFAGVTRTFLTMWEITIFLRF